MSTKDTAGGRDAGSARLGDRLREQPLGRKSMLLGMLTSGFVIANAAQPSTAAAAGTVKPGAIAATPTPYIPTWTPSTAYGRGKQVVSPYNDVVSATVAHTSSAAYATDVSKWTVSVTYVKQKQTMADLAMQAGVDSTGVTECAAAIQTAFTSAAATGVRIFARGTYKIASTITVTSNADLTDATFNYTATSGTAIRVGGAPGVPVGTLLVNLPSVIATAKTVTGWTQVTGTIGVELHNLNQSLVYVPSITSFGTGLRVTGQAEGCCYNIINLGILNNNKVNLLLDADTTGWSNQNLYNGGRFCHDSSEASNGSGCRDLAMLVCPNPVNTNTFATPSFEGDTPEFHAAIAGSANVLLNARWEASTPKVRWESDARNNQILYGFNPQDIVEEWVAGSDTNMILTGRSSRFTGGNGSAGTLVMENTGSSNYPTDIVMYAGGIMAGANPATAYCVARGASATNMKRSTDAYPRLKLDHVNGRVYLGGGSSAPTAYLDATGFHP